jgi:hypothetical protein
MTLVRVCIAWATVHLVADRREVTCKGLYLCKCDGFFLGQAASKIVVLGVLTRAGKRENRNRPRRRR